MTACGLDFGTSNSAIGVLRGGRPTLAPMEGDSTLLPSAIFFDYENRGRVHFGRAAIDSYVEQHEGRLMRAIKSVLGSPLINEKTAVAGRMMSFLEIIELYIKHMKAKAETFADHEITAVVHGRPVRFVDDDDFADARAEGLLESVARSAGFQHVAFVYEPIAAAYQYEEELTTEQTVLVCDIGGGTSDFAVVRVGPSRKRKPDRAHDLLASTGAKIGGTDFDALLSLHSVMPLFGLGSHLRTKDLPVPNSLYFELANWATINFIYTQQNEREADWLARNAYEPTKLGRLLKVIQSRLGHRVALSVEGAKIALSDADCAAIDLGFVEERLHTQSTSRDLNETIGASTGRLRLLAIQCIRDAGLRPSDIQAVFLTGGSSRVPAVREAVLGAAPEAVVARGSDMVSVGLGLTREAARRFA